MTQLGMFGEHTEVSLQGAAREVLDCRRCDLWRSGARAVFGYGNPKARLMIVGEGPSEADDRTGEPFSGPSGNLLDGWIEGLGLTREHVWLTNVVKHRPIAVEKGREKNRPPKVSETNACRVWLDLELSAVHPSLILALGGSAGKALLGKDFKISQQRGVLVPGPGEVPVIATFHPAYLLRLESPQLEEAEDLVRQDLYLVKRELGV